MQWTNCTVDIGQEQRIVPKISIRSTVLWTDNVVTYISVINVQQEALQFSTMTCDCFMNPVVVTQLLVHHIQCTCTQQHIGYNLLYYTMAMSVNVLHGTGYAFSVRHVECSYLV